MFIDWLWRFLKIFVDTLQVDCETMSSAAHVLSWVVRGGPHNGLG